MQLPCPQQQKTEMIHIITRIRTAKQFIKRRNCSRMLQCNKCPFYYATEGCLLLYCSNDSGKEISNPFKPIQLELLKWTASGYDPMIFIQKNRGNL